MDGLSGGFQFPDLLDSSFLRLLVLQKFFHDVGIDLLIGLPPVIADNFRLILRGNRYLHFDQRLFPFADFTLNDIFLVCGPVVIRDDTDFIPKPHLVLLQEQIDIFHNGFRDRLAEETKCLFAFPRNLIPGTVPNHFLLDQMSFQKLVQRLLQCKIGSVLLVQKNSEIREPDSGNLA